MSWGFGIATWPLGCNVNISIRGGNHLGEVWGGEIHVVIMIIIIVIVIVIVITIIVIVILVIIIIIIITVIIIIIMITVTIIIIIIIIIIITVGPRRLRTKAPGRCGGLAGHVLVEGFRLP